MNTQLSPRVFVCVVSLFAVLAFTPAPAIAANLTVNCDAGDSLQAATNSLDPVGPHLITVTGTCTGKFFINGLNRLTVEAPAGQRATLVSDTPGTGIVLEVRNSRRLMFRRLTITGGWEGIRLQPDTEATFEMCTSENNTRQGVRVLDHSIGRFVGMESAPFISRNNGAQGIDVASSVVQVSGVVTIENNGFPQGGSGLRLSSSQAYLTADLTGSGGPITIRGNNGYGLQVFAGSALTINGAAQIENNAFGGAAVWLGSSANITGDADAGSLVIANNPNVGMFITESSVAVFGPMQIVNNGSGSEPAGLIVSGGGWMQMANADISGNAGLGVLVEANGSIDLWGSRITNNAQGGLLVRRLGYAWMGTYGTPMMISGNGGANVACDSTALIAGDLTGIAQVSCTRIERATGPPRRGRVLPESGPPGPPNP